MVYETKQAVHSEYSETDIAIVGLSLKFPGASSAAEFWDNLREGRESIVDLTDEELLAAGVLPSLLVDPQYVKRAPLLKGVGWFDAAFFGLNPNEASVMDPQHRLFLECGWHALEDAGYDPATFGGPIGVFGGSGYNAYMTYHLSRNRELMNSMGFFLLRHTGNDKDFLTTRLSYCLNLTGPSVNVQTACSTSLVAMHLAAQSLLNYECDMALAGGVTIELPLNHGYRYSPGEIYSPDGHCRAFDADSQGTVFGSGCGIVALRRLQDAINDGDNIRAIIKASAINNDGAGKAGYLAPSVEGQAKAIIEALEFSGVDPESITYIETHGTGTAVGDPIEISALTAAYASRTEKKQFCGIGSVKTNIGHLDTAAGVASVIKAVLALEHKCLPPSLHFKRPNPEIDFLSTPFYVNATLQDWQPPAGQPRRAGVSSLGVGGTNAHLILEEAPPTTVTGESRETRLFLLSARNEISLQSASDNLVEFIATNKHSLSDVAYTLQVGRHHFEKRRAVICRSGEELINRLDSDQHPLVVSGVPKQTTPPVVFMFTGQGAQYPGMTRQLYETEALFRKQLDECAAILLRTSGLDIKALLFESKLSDTASIEPINQTENTQPALFVVEYCLARLWLSWGIKPDAMIGHSIGEYIAACLSGVFTLENCLKLVSLRGKLMQSARTGAMLAVPKPLHEVQKYLSDKVEMAAINTTSLCVLSGDKEDILKVQEDLEKSGSAGTLLRTSHAFHSRSMEPILAEFEKAVASAEPQAPDTPFISNLTGGWITDEEAVSPAYWSQHLRQPVLFAAGVAKLLEDSERVFLEVGPSAVLAQLVRQHEKFMPTNTVVASLGGPKSEHTDAENLHCALGRLWVTGVSLDWNAYYALEQRRRIPAPVYAFNRQHYWIDRDDNDSQNPLATSEATSASTSALQYNKIYWVDTGARSRAEFPGAILVIGHPDSAAGNLANILAEKARVVISARFSDRFQALDDANFAIRATVAEDYESLLAHADKSGVTAILHCANLAPSATRELSDAISDCFVSPLLTLQSAASLPEASICFLSTGAYAVAGEGSINPLGALAAGPSLVAGLELPHLHVSGLDVVDHKVDDIVDGVLRVLAQQSRRPSVYALRSGTLYSKHFSPCTPESKAGSAHEQSGCYLVTGGLSGIGLEVSRHLVQTGIRQIAILGRTRLPAEKNWQNWLAEHTANDPVTVRIHHLIGLRNTGAKVHYYAADLADESALTNCIACIRNDFDSVSGVMHCAGHLDDGPLLTKDIRNALAVLSPKVQGTLALARLLADQPLKDILLFSSVSSLWGTPGQIDYVAANAFLDAVVPVLQAQFPARVLSINWAAWRETGMTERLANPVMPENAQIAHPLLDRCLYDDGRTSVYATEMFAAKHWVINEHRAAGSLEPILPGTGFLEIVKAAFEPLVSESHLQLTDVMFLSPFVLTDEAPRELRVQFEPWSLGTTFSVISQADPEDRESWFVHMKGRIGHGRNEKRTINLAAIGARCGPRQPHPNEQLKYLSFGPRWETIQSLQIGSGEALLELALREELRNDVNTIWSHPGMMDVATAGVLKLVEGYDPQQHFYVPIAYNRIDFYGAMPAKWFSHIVYRADESQPGDIVVFDVTIADEHGNVLAVFEEFMLKRIDGPDSLVKARPPLSARISPLATDFVLTSNSALRQRLDDSGISVADGVHALGEILAGNLAGQVAVSNGSLDDRLAEIAATAVDASGSGRNRGITLDVSPVEKLLNAHPAVVKSAVVAHEDRFGVSNVAAFVQLEPMLTTTVSELRRYVRKEVDSQLVPSKFIEVHQLPLRPDGEIDRKQLPDPFGANDNFIAPSTEMEKQLTRIWQDILGVDQISITDNFFDLGGHSLLGVRLLAALRKATGIRLEDVVVVTYTLEQIAAELEKRIKAGNGN